MLLAINLANLLLASAGTIIVLFGDTHNNGRLRRLGKMAVSCLVVGVCVGIAQLIVNAREDDRKEQQITELTTRTKMANEQLEKQGSELAAVRGENNMMRAALARMPQQRAIASIATVGQPFHTINNVQWYRYAVQLGPASPSGEQLTFSGGELVRYNTGIRDAPGPEPEMYLEVGGWRYPLANNGEFAIFPAANRGPQRATLVANVPRRDFDVHLVIQVTGDNP